MMALSPPQRSFINHLVLMEFEEGVMSERRFLEGIGIPQSTSIRWKKEPQFVAALIAAKHSYIASPDYYATCLRQKTLYGIEEDMEKARVKRGAGNDRRQYQKMVLDLTKDADASASAPVTFDHYTDDELLTMMLARDIMPQAASEALAAAKGDDTDAPLPGVNTRGRSAYAVGSVGGMVPPKRRGGRKRRAAGDAESQES